MNNFRRFAVIIMICALLMACGEDASQSSGGSTSGTAVAGEYPPMGVKELDEFLAKNKGTPTMLLFWTTWCPSCKEELPELEALKASHGNMVNVITVSLDENIAALDTFLGKKKLDLPVYHGDEAIARKFGVEAIPTLVMFDKNGKMIFGKPGVFPHSMLEKMAEKLASQ